MNSLHGENKENLKKAKLENERKTNDDQTIEINNFFSGGQIVTTDLNANAGEVIKFEDDEDDSCDEPEEESENMDVDEPSDNIDEDESHGSETVLPSSSTKHRVNNKFSNIAVKKSNINVNCGDVIQASSISDLKDLKASSNRVKKSVIMENTFNSIDASGSSINCNTGSVTIIRKKRK